MFIAQITNTNNRLGINAGWATSNGAFGIKKSRYGESDYWGTIDKVRAEDLIQAMATWARTERHRSKPCEKRDGLMQKKITMACAYKEDAANDWRGGGSLAQLVYST